MGQSVNKKAIIYCRVSTKEQVDEGNSLITQERICRDYAHKNGYEVARVFIEEGESAKNAARLELQLMLKYCSQNRKEIEALIIYKIDRLSRNTDDYSQLRVFFQKTKILILSTTENFENNPVGRFVENMLANVAQFDNDVRAERCRNGMIEAARNGRYPFKAPFGYQNGKVDGEPNLEIHKEKSKFIKHIFEQLSTGLYSQEDVRREVNKNGALLDNGKYISKQYMNLIVKNKVYKGVIDSFGLGEIKGTFKPIINEELFDKVQLVIEGRAKRKTGYNTFCPDFPLRGLIISEGGHKLDGSWSKGNAREKMPYYRFRGLNGFNTRKDVLESKFNDFLEKFEFKDDFVDLLKDSLSINWEHRNLSNNQLKKQTEKKIGEFKARRELIIDKNLRGVIEDDLTKEQLGKIKLEITKLTIQLKDFEGVDNIKEVLDYSLNLMKNLTQEIEKLKIAQRKNLQWFLFPEGIVYDGKKLRTLKTALILDTKMTSQIKKSNVVGQNG